MKTRLAWLDLNFGQLADVIGMDKSTLSRALRADRPRPRTIARIATGLGMTPEQLSDDEDSGALTQPHPALVNVSVNGTNAKIDKIRDWIDSSSPVVASQ